MNYTKNQNRWFGSGSIGKSLLQYRRRPSAHFESPQSSRYSDDEMTELLPFNERGLFNPKMIEDEVERLYITELIHQDMVAAELGRCYQTSMDGARRNMQPSIQDLQEDFCPCTQLRNKSLENSGLFNESKVRNLYLGYKPVNKNPNTNRTDRNPNNRNNNNQTNNLGTKSSQTTICRKIGSTQTRKPEVESSLTQVSKKIVKSNQKNLSDDDQQRVFLGGLPVGMTERMLRQRLAALGYKVLKRPKILHGFAPEVWLKTVDQAKDLIEKGTIIIDGMKVEVRPYNSLTKLSELKKLPNVGKRSVFIGGLSRGTTTKNLQDVLLDMGMKVINYPVIKHGFARQIILGTISQAKILIKMKKIQVNETFVDVRPFVNTKRKRRILKKLNII